MTRKTKSVVVESPRKMAMWEFDLPQIGQEDALLKVEMVGVCGSDVGVYLGKQGDPPTPYPLIMGHEIVGIIEDAGKTFSDRNSLKKGDRAIILCNFGCGYCYSCLLGRFTHCETKPRYGLTLSCKDFPHLWGAYGEYLYIAPRAMVVKIDEDIVPEVGVLIAAVIANGIRWMRTQGGVTIGDTVVIQGPGPQGLAGIIAAKESGASRIIITGLGKDKKRCELAQAFGATDIINVEKEDPLRAVKEITQGKMANIVMDTTGNPAAARLLFDLVGTYGTIVFPGIYGFKEIPMVLDRIYAKELTIRGVRGQNITSVKAAINLAKSKKYPLEKMVTHRFPLEEAEKAVQLVAGEIKDEGLIKAVLIP